MNDIDELFAFELSADQKTWLNAIWKSILETGDIPSYRSIRIETLKKVSEDFDPFLIDENLLEARSNEIKLLGVLCIDLDLRMLLQEVVNLIDYSNWKTPPVSTKGAKQPPEN